jgi:hypothetical protein
MLVARQVDEGGPAVRGAWFTHGRSRMDDQQHALSALVLAQPTLEAAAEAGDTDAVGEGEEAHGLLWVVLAVVAAVDPPRWPRPRRPVPVVAAAAAAGALALASGPVLDALDVSPASARLAAGAAVVVASVAAVVVPRAPATDGVVAGALAVLALALGADDGAVTLAGIAVAAGLVVGLPDRWRRPALAAAVAVAALLFGVDLLVDGVLGV